MKTETHVGNAVLFLNGILMISVLTEPFGGWWWFWCGWGILLVVARVIRNFIPGFFITLAIFAGIAFIGATFLSEPKGHMVEVHEDGTIERIAIA